MLAKELMLAAVLLLLAFPAAVNAQSSTDADAEYSRKGADTCLACHQDEVTLAIFSTRHAIPSDSDGPFGHGQLQCEACHGPGDAHAGRVRRGQERPPVVQFGDGAVSSIETQNSMCVGCHTDDIGVGWHSGPHGADEVACADCHNSHERSDPVLQTSTQVEVCADCHQLQKNATLKAFSHPLLEEQMNCTSCHSMHDDLVATELARATVNDTCFGCHAEKRGPFLWEHAPASEDCGLCHSPHGSNHPGMLTQRAPLLCQSCHSQSGHPSVAFDNGSLTDAAASQFILGQSCLNCHSQVHGSNHPSGSNLSR